MTIYCAAQIRQEDLDYESHWGKENLDTLKNLSIADFEKIPKFKDYLKIGYSYIQRSKNIDWELHYIWYRYKGSVSLKLYPEYNADSTMLKNVNLIERTDTNVLKQQLRIHRAEICSHRLINRSENVKYDGSNRILFRDSLIQSAPNFEGKTLRDLIADPLFGKFITISTTSHRPYICSTILLYYSDMVGVEVRFKRAEEYQRYNGIYSQVLLIWNINSLMDYKIGFIKVD